VVVRHRSPVAKRGFDHVNAFSLWALIFVGGVAFALLGVVGFRWMIPRKPPTGMTYLRSAGFVVAALAAGLVFGQVAHWDDARRLDEAIHESIFLVQNDLAIRAMAAVTGIGAIAATGFVIALLAAGVGYNYRSLRLLLVPVVAYVVALQSQRLVDRLDDRSKPPLDLSVGIPGGYPSGGTVRVVLVVGLLAVVFAQLWRREEDVRLLGAVWGALAWTEIASRAVLGRHWPLDLIAGLVMGVLLLAAMGPLMWLPAGGRAAEDRVADSDPAMTARSEPARAAD
jgi:membrane-associated phospholipid phosphatase